MIFTQVQPVLVALNSAFLSSTSIGARVHRVEVLFPDVGQPCVQRIGFFRYQGERSFVLPHATPEELQELPGLEVVVERGRPAFPR